MRKRSLKSMPDQNNRVALGTGGSGSDSLGPGDHDHSPSANMGQEPQDDGFSALQLPFSQTSEMTRFLNSSKEWISDNRADLDVLDDIDDLPAGFFGHYSAASMRPPTHMGHNPALSLTDFRQLHMYTDDSNGHIKDESLNMETRPSHNQNPFVNDGGHVNPSKLMIGGENPGSYGSPGMLGHSMMNTTGETPDYTGEAASMQQQHQHQLQLHALHLIEQQQLKDSQRDVQLQQHHDPRTSGPHIQQTQPGKHRPTNQSINHLASQDHPAEKFATPSEASFSYVSSPMSPLPGPQHNNHQNSHQNHLLLQQEHQNQVNNVTQVNQMNQSNLHPSAHLSKKQQPATENEAQQMMNSSNFQLQNNGMQSKFSPVPLNTPIGMGSGSGLSPVMPWNPNSPLPASYMAMGKFNAFSPNVTGPASPFILTQNTKNSPLPNGDFSLNASSSAALPNNNIDSTTMDTENPTNDASSRSAGEAAVVPSRLPNPGSLTDCHRVLLFFPAIAETVIYDQKGEQTSIGLKAKLAGGFFLGELAPSEDKTGKSSESDKDKDKDKVRSVDTNDRMQNNSSEDKGSADATRTDAIKTEPADQSETFKPSAEPNDSNPQSSNPNSKGSATSKSKPKAPVQYELTFYRRNLFEVTATVSNAHKAAYAANPENPSLRSRILSLSLTATVLSSEDKTPKTLMYSPPKSSTNEKDKTEIEPPVKFIYPTDSQYHDVVSWKRLQFRSATSHNGHRNSQHYFSVCVSLFAELENTQRVCIMNAYSRPIVVRGRNPRFYSNRNNIIISDLVKRPSEMAQLLNAAYLNGNYPDYVVTHSIKDSFLSSLSLDLVAAYEDSEDDISQGHNQNDTNQASAIIGGDAIDSESPLDQTGKNGKSKAKSKPKAKSKSKPKSKSKDKGTEMETEMDKSTTNNTSNHETYKDQMQDHYQQHATDNFAIPKVVKTGNANHRKPSFGSSVPSTGPQRANSFSFTEEEDSEDEINRARRQSDAPERNSSEGNYLDSRRDSVGKNKEVDYEYFPLPINYWLPPVEVVYRPHAVHHPMAMPPSKPRSMLDNTKRYFSSVE